MVLLTFYKTLAEQHACVLNINSLKTTGPTRSAAARLRQENVDILEELSAAGDRWSLNAAAKVSLLLVMRSKRGVDAEQVRHMLQNVTVINGR